MIFFKRHIISLILFSTLLAAPPAQSEQQVEIFKKYYSVSGKTAAAIRKSLNRNSPIRSGNKRYDAFTRWYVSWRFRFTMGSNGCFISNVFTTTEITHTLPKVTNSLSPALQEKWLTYTTALMEHEQGHSNLGIEAAKEIEIQLRALPGRSVCEELADTANHLGKKIIDKYVAKEKDYDRATQHGMVTGALFP